MPSNRGKTAASSIVGSEISRTHSLASVQNVKLKFDDLPICDKRQSLKCLQQQLFIAVSAMAYGRGWIGAKDLEYREQTPLNKALAEGNLQCPFIRKEVKNNLAAQIRRYVFIACTLFERGELAEFRLQVVKVGSSEVVEELGFMFESTESSDVSSAEEQWAEQLDRKPRKITLLDSIASIEAAREKLMHIIGLFCAGATKLRDQVKLEINSKTPTVTVVPWFLCRQQTNYFDKELINGSKVGGAQQTGGKKRGKAAGKNVEEAELLKEGFHSFRRTAVADIARLSGGTYVRMLQLKSAYHGMTVYAKVHKNTLADWGKRKN